MVEVGELESAERAGVEEVTGRPGVIEGAAAELGAENGEASAKKIDELLREATGVVSAESGTIRKPHCLSYASHSGRAATIRTMSIASA
jgi:hypothetical protein